MALTSALFTGLSGLDVNQTRLNVIGNNIANVNTTAFKSSRVLFTPQFYVTDSGGAPPTSDFGGTNPTQRGLGATVGSIEKDMTGGSIEPTGKLTDLAIEGAGFFIAKSAAGTKFTRDGSFTLNSSNQLVTAAGSFVQGNGVDKNFNLVPGQLQNLTIPVGTAISAEASQNVTFQGNLDANGTLAAGASVLNTQPLTAVGGGAAAQTTDLLTNVAATAAPATALFSVGQTFTLQGKVGTRDSAAANFTVTATSTVQDLMSFFQNSLGINTTAPSPAGAPAPGASLIADPTDPLSSLFTVTGNAGNDNALTLSAGSFTTNTGAAPLSFAKGTDGAGIANNPSGESVETTAIAYDSLGTPISVNVTTVLQSRSTAGTVWQFYANSPDNKGIGQSIGAGTLSFDNNGKLLSSTGNGVSVDRTGTGAKSPLAFNLDFSHMSSLSDTHPSQMVMTKQDGSPIGTLGSYSIGTDGVITGSFTNGLTRTVGQVAIATFDNPGGLVDDGANMYSTSADSGVPIITTPLSQGSGSIRSGALELSNVDLSKEFTNLIVASTGFSAASRVIQTSDRLLSDLLHSQG